MLNITHTLCVSVGEGPRGQELGEGERQHQEVHAADEGGRLTHSQHRLFHLDRTVLNKWS